MTYEEALAVATANNEIDENQTFLIDKNLRTVTIPDGFVLGVFNDKNVQIVPFAMPRYYNGIDMSTFAIQVNYVNSAGDGDIYLVFDQDVQEDLILFDWVVDRTAFATSGRTGFVVCMKEDDEYGYVAREFNTTLAYAPVLDGLEIDNPIDDQEVLDVLTQIRRAAELADIAAQQAENSAAQASTDATTASNAATSASTSADTATAAQQSASASATSATNAETNALAYRNAAAASAAEASAVVSGIDDVLSFPNALVVESATSEDIVTIEDGADNIPMTSVLATMNPIQDLNGYDKPWAGGGGKNLLENTQSSVTRYGVTFTVNSDGSVTASGTSTSDAAQLQIPISVASIPQDTRLYFSGCPSGGSSSTYQVYIWDTTTNSRAKKWDNITNSADDVGSSANNEVYFESGHEGIYNIRIRSGATVNNLVFKPMIRLATESDGTFAPYSNICPISGRTGLTVTRSGKNLLKNTAETITEYGVTFTCNEDGTVSTSGTSTKNANYLLLGIQTLAAGTYVFSGCPSGGGATVYYQRANRGRTPSGSSAVRLASDYGDGGTFTLTEPTEIVTYIACDSGKNMDGLVFRPMIRLASDTDTYEAPQNTEIPITWESIAGTVYGGTLDVVSGVLTVNRFFKAFDGTETGWTKAGGTSNNTQRYYITWENMDVSGVANPSDAICSHLVFLSGNAGAFGTFNCTVTNFAVKDGDGSQFADITAFKAWLAAQNTNGTPLQLCVELAESTTYQITPTEIKTLLGGNTIYTDAGDVSVEYRADLKMYIDKKIAEAIA